jgi:hypothetical protein
MNTSRSRTSPSSAASPRSAPRSRPRRAEGTSRRTSAIKARIRRSPTRIWWTASGSSPVATSSAFAPICWRQSCAIPAIARPRVASPGRSIASARRTTGSTPERRRSPPLGLRMHRRSEGDVLRELQRDVVEVGGRPPVVLELDLADRLPGEAGADLAAIEAEAPLADLVAHATDLPLEGGLEDGLERLLADEVDQSIAQRRIRDRPQIRSLPRAPRSRPRSGRRGLPPHVPRA